MRSGNMLLDKLEELNVNIKDLNSKIDKLQGIQEKIEMNTKKAEVVEVVGTQEEEPLEEVVAEEGSEAPVEVVAPVNEEEPIV